MMAPEPPTLLQRPPATAHHALLHHRAPAHPHASVRLRQAPGQPSPQRKPLPAARCQSPKPPAAAPLRDRGPSSACKPNEVKTKQVIRQHQADEPVLPKWTLYRSRLMCSGAPRLLTVSSRLSCVHPGALRKQRGAAFKGNRATGAALRKEALRCSPETEDRSLHLMASAAWGYSASASCRLPSLPLPYSCMSRFQRTADITCAC